MSRTANIHRFFVWLHRWTGLALTAFLVVVGLTGSLLAFRGPVDRLINPQLFAHHAPGAAVLDLATLAERAEAIEPRARPGYFAIDDDTVVIASRPRIDPATKKRFVLGFDHLILDPYTGKELGRRLGSSLSQGRINVMQFVYDLHTFLVFGNTGALLLGFAALAWTLDSFVGLYLTLPRGSGRFWIRWKQAWWVKWRANAFRVNFDLHRSSGLWFWIMIIPFAWSSVMLSLHPLYDRVTAAIFDYEDDSLVFKELLPQPKEDPKLGWRQGLEASQRAMADQAARRHLTNVRPYGLSYIPEFGVYSYSVRTDQDIRDHGWDTGVWVDADTGAFRKLFLPSGLHAGNTLTNLLWALHYGDFRGSILFRLLVCLFGFILVLLSGTGVYVWWRKRQITKRGMARARCVVAAD